MRPGVGSVNVGVRGSGDGNLAAEGLVVVGVELLLELLVELLVELLAELLVL